MNFRNKYFAGTLRTLFGLFMIFSGVSGFVVGMEGVPEEMKAITQVFWNSGVFQLIKITEIAAGVMLAVNFLPALGAIFIAPIAVGVIVFNAMLSPAYLPIGILVAILNAYLGYVYWDKYKVLFRK